MSRRISISQEDAEAIRSQWLHTPDEYRLQANAHAFERIARGLERPNRVAAKRKRSAKTSPELMRALNALMSEHKSRKPTKAQRRNETAAIWEACWARCADPVRGYHVCECGCGRPVLRKLGNLDDRAELEHPFSKGKGARLPQSVETCWILRADCHRDRHAARPSAEAWWEKFLRHLQRHLPPVPSRDSGYYDAWDAASKRLRFVETRSKLGVGLKERQP